nr:PGF-CTERM sorting domain-containing protein [uncultured Methanolobus sp.]
MKEQQKSIYKKVSIYLILLSLGLMSAQVACAETYTLDQQWNISDAEMINDIDVDSSGNVYVAVDGAYIMKFDSAGNFLAKYGEGTEDEFTSAQAVAVDSSGNVYAPYYNEGYQIVKFDSNGNIIMDIDTSDIYYDGYGTSLSITDIAVDSSGNIYALDSHFLIFKFDSSGNFVSGWGPEWRILNGNQDALIADVAVAVDSSDNIYSFSSSGDDTVIKLDSDGNLLAKWKSGFAIERDRAYLVVDQADNVHALTDTRTLDIYTFDSSGNLLSEQDLDGYFSSNPHFAFDSSSNVWYYCSRHSNEIQKYAIATQDTVQNENVEQTSVQTQSADSVSDTTTEETTTEETQSSKSPGFGIVCGIVGLFAAVLYNKR